MDMTELKTLLEQQGQTFEAFKKSHEEQITELKKQGSNDPVLVERLGKIEKSLDAAVEAKAAFDAAMKAEVKEREELEKRLNRLGNFKGSEEAAKKACDVRDFNHILLAHNSSKSGSKFEPFDEAQYDAYKAAHMNYLRKGDRLLSAEEMKLLSVGSDPDGGYFVTPDLGGRIVKKVFETSPVRQYASIQQIGTDALEGIEDTGDAGTGYAGEHATSGDTTTPQIGKWRIPVFWIDTEPKTTQQLLDDANVDVEAWLAAKVASKMARFENTEFVTGSAGKILGFVNGYTQAADSGSGVTWGQIGYLATGVDADWAASNKGDKLIDLIGLLKNQYLTGAAWFLKRALIAEIRKFKDGQGNYLWTPGFNGGTAESILGFPVARMEDMPTKASGSFSVAFGNLQEAYQIVDRMGIRVLRDNLTAKPYVKFYTTKRVGGGVLNYEAIKLLKFGTS